MIADRLARVAQLERVLAHAPIIERLPLPGAHKGMNDVPELVRLLDDVTGETVEAVLKTPRAQAAQDAFAWQVGREMQMEDLLAVAVHRADRREGVLVERALGSHVKSPVLVRDALQRAHAGDADPAAAARIDLHRLVGFDYVMANADRHLAQISVSPSGALAYDHGMIGYRLGRTGSRQVTPVRDALFGVAGLRPPAGIERRSQLDPAAVEALVSKARPEAIAHAHESLLASVRAPSAWNMRSTSRFVRSDEYIDGVLERLDRLKNTGEIAYVHTTQL